MTGTRVVIAAVGVALVLGVAACSGDDPEPRVAPQSSSAPSSPSTSPASVEIGPAQAFAAWVHARNDALQSGDIAAVQRLSAHSCRTCDNAIEPIAEVYSKGGHYETEGWIIVASRVKRQTAQKARVSAALKYASGTTVPEAGADPVSYAVERHIVLVDLAQSDGQWLVKYIGYLS